jgi:hypothetical protein
MKSISILLKDKQRAAQRMPDTAEIIKGTLIAMERVCGKPNCQCRKGAKHACLCVSQYVNGRSRMVYIPKAMEKRVRHCVENYRQIKACIRQLSEINLELMKRGI